MEKKLKGSVENSSKGVDFHTITHDLHTETIDLQN